MKNLFMKELFFKVQETSLWTVYFLIVNAAFAGAMKLVLLSYIGLLSID